jgi:VanZ family protein
LKTRVCPRIAAALWGGFLFLLTSWPNPPVVASGGFPLDKATHFLLYAVEAFLLSRAIAWPGRTVAVSRILAVVGTMAVWGALDEVHQEWIPGRKMDSGDLAADVAGAVVGASVAALSRKRGEAGRTAIS